jgi:hypothetical protein
MISEPELGIEKALKYEHSHYKRCVRGIEFAIATCECFEVLARFCTLYVRRQVRDHRVAQRLRSFDHGERFVLGQFTRSGACLHTAEIITAY